MRKCLRFLTRLLVCLLAATSLCSCTDILEYFVTDLSHDKDIIAAEAVPKIAFGNEELSENSGEVVMTVDEVMAAELVSAEICGNYHLNQLDEAGRTVCRAYLYAIEKGYKYIYVDELIETKTDDLEKAFIYLSLDSPFLEQNYNYEVGTFTTSYDIGKGKKAPLEGVYLCALNFTAEHWSKKTEALNKARDIVAKMPQNKSEADRAEYLYNYILKNVTYLDYEDADVAAEHFLYDGLIKGKTHCDGTANMYSLLLNLAGVENFERSYDGSDDKVGHTWNAVKLDGVWYNTDATALRDREDFDFRIKRTFAIEERLLSYPSTVDAVYPSFDKNLRFSLIEADSISVKELSREMCDRIRKDGYAAALIKNYNEKKMEDVAQKVANSLSRTVNWYESDVLNGAKMVNIK